MEKLKKIDTNISSLILGINTFIGLHCSLFFILINISCKHFACIQQIERGQICVFKTATFTNVFSKKKLLSSKCVYKLCKFYFECLLLRSMLFLPLINVLKLNNRKTFFVKFKWVFCASWQHSCQSHSA